MEVELTTLSHEDVRDRLGFYTNEASRAALMVTVYRAHKRDLLRKATLRRARVIANFKGTKWQADAKAEADEKVQKYRDRASEADSLIEMLEELAKMYDRNAFALSRELTARDRDRERWQGRGGAANP